ncbi:hypothetical protein J2W46_006822 [Paraburkholderia strydomiana]|nr:hypothetical protein [Paraburkholderia strydomiana]
MGKMFDAQSIMVACAACYDETRLGAWPKNHCHMYQSRRGLLFPAPSYDVSLCE